jgi:zinc transporter ZupT
LGAFFQSNASISYSILVGIALHEFPAAFALAIILKGLKFPRRGKYRVALEQYMRTDTLVGVVSVGASLVPSPL